MRLTDKLENLEFYATAASKYLNNLLKPSTIKKYSKEIKEALIALEIIKEKEIDIDLFNDTPNIDEYNYWCSDKATLSKEEYNLLKEILK